MGLRYRMYAPVLMALCWILAGGVSTPAAAEERPAVQTEEKNSGEPEKTKKDLTEMSLEDLINVEVVVSASRQAQPRNRLAVPVSIITAEDIHYSGLTRLPEIMQFAPGVDMVQLDRNRYALGIHGFHDMFSDRTQILIDGRVADHPLFGGPEWFSFPILTEDIERIEIVRGPGGAAWGANAFTGMINIITKEPEKCLGWFASSTATHFGDSYSHIRWAEKKGNLSWKTSVGYEDTVDSEAAGYGDFEAQSAGAGTLLGVNSWNARDFSRTWRTDNVLTWTISDQVKSTYGAAWNHLDMGDFEFGGYFPREDAWQNTGRFFNRLDFTGDNEDTGYIQWFGNFYKANQPSLLKYYAGENSLDGQYNFKLTDAHEVSAGGNFRWTRYNTFDLEAQQMDILTSPEDEYTAGAFAIDRWKLADRFTLESQIRGNWYSETEKDWAARMGLLYAMDEKEHHILRFSWAKAFRTPFATLRDLSTSRMLIPPSFYAFNLRPAEHDLKDEQTIAFETGYYGQIAPGFTCRVDGYRQQFDNLISYLPPTAVKGNPALVYIPDNLGEASIYGVDTELALENAGVGKFSVWYSYEELEKEHRNQSIRSFEPARHKTGLTGRLVLPHHWTLNLNYKYSTFAMGDPLAGRVCAPSAHRLDLTLAKSFADGHGELMVGVSDLLETSHDPILAFGEITALEYPGRTFFVRMQMQF